MFAKTVIATIAVMLATVTSVPLVAPGLRGVDVVGPLNDVAAQCLVKSGYAAVFLRVYNSGKVDITGLNNIKTYTKCKL